MIAQTISYLIEGDPTAFDDAVFSADELNEGVVVKVSERQWRYSKFPAVPLFRPCRS